MRGRWCWVALVAFGCSSTELEDLRETPDVETGCDADRLVTAAPVVWAHVVGDLVFYLTQAPQRRLRRIDRTTGADDVVLESVVDAHGFGDVMYAVVDTDRGHDVHRVEAESTLRIDMSIDCRVVVARDDEFVCHGRDGTFLVDGRGDVVRQLSSVAMVDAVHGGDVRCYAFETDAFCGPLRTDGEFGVVASNVRDLHAVDDAHLYYSGLGVIARVGIGGGTMRILQTHGVGRIESADLDGRHFYWRAQGVWRSDLASGAVEPFCEITSGAIVGGTDRHLLVNAPLRVLRK